MCLSPVITIDGPSGSGKSTLSKALAKHLNWFTLESGIIYRILACLYLKKNQLICKNTLKNLLYDLDNYFIYKNGFIYKILNNEFSYQYIMSNEVTMHASKLSSISYIRNYLLLKQRLFLRPPGLIANGRDMGTVVFPKAILKFFLYAKIKNRVNRRIQEFKNYGININPKIMYSEIKKRDDRDSNRKCSPLIPAKDAIILDSSNMTRYEVLKVVMNYINNITTLNVKLSL